MIRIGKHRYNFIGITSGGKTANGEYALSGSGTYRKDKKRNMRTIWKKNTKSQKSSHIAVFPEDLIKIPIQAGCPIGGIVLDPFIGSGTTGKVARDLERNFIGIEKNKEYIDFAKNRIGIN